MDEETESVAISVGNCKILKNRPPIIALCDVLLEIAGIEIKLNAVQVRRYKDNCAVELPHTTNCIGHPIEAIELPAEINAAIGRAVAEEVALRLGITITVENGLSLIHISEPTRPY